MTRIVWGHQEDLSPTNPALLKYPDAPAIFVFDPASLAAQGHTLKRVLFQYECLLEMPVTIRRGDPVEQIKAFAQEQGAEQIVTTPSPDPEVQAVREALSRWFSLETVAGEPMVRLKRPVPLKRFSRYWKQAEQTAFGDR